MRHDTNAFHWPKLNLTLILTPRVGSTSIKRAIIGPSLSYHKNDELESKRISYEESVVLGRQKKNTTIATIRDPIERFVSVWKGLVRDRDWKNFNEMGIGRNTSLIEFAKTLATSERGFNDIHVKPTSQYHIKEAWPLSYKFLEEEWGMYIRSLFLPFSDIEWNENYTIPVEYDRQELKNILYPFYKKDKGWNDD